jgi:segregation and condensation protein A
MSLSAAGHQIGDYTVTTPIYQGPLDLLLQLIEKAELDITSFALAQVTEQFLVHIRQIQECAADEVSAFLVIAAKLIQIKSEALLPRPPTRLPGEEDPGQALARQLIAYKRYRQIAELLSERETANLRSYLRLASPSKIDGVVDLSDITLQDLVSAAQQIFAEASLKTNLSNLVPPPRVTIREKIVLLASALRTRKQISFSSLFTSHRTRLEIVVTFLAMLELVKRHLVHASQDKLFGEITLDATENWNESDEFELEFGE